MEDITDDFMKGLNRKNKNCPYASDILAETQILLCNSTAFDEELFSKVEEISIKYLPVGSFVITSTKKFKSANWKIIFEEEMQMSWARTIIFIYQKEF